MRTIRIKLFKFNELNTAAKQAAIKNHRECVLRQDGGPTGRIISPDKLIIETFERYSYEFTKEGQHIPPNNKPNPGK